MTRTSGGAVGGWIVAIVLMAEPVRADQQVVEHVRSSDPAVRELIVVATTQSATFSGLVTHINAITAIVYVERGLCSRGVKACLVSLTAKGHHRFLWIHIEEGQTDIEIMGSIGHELRHAVEVFGDETVRTTAGLHNFYHHAIRSSGGVSRPFETEAATVAGDAVRSEVRRYRRGQLSR